MKRLEVRNENKSHAVLGLGEIHGYAANIGSDGLKQLLSFTFVLGKFCFCFTTLTIFVNWLETALVCREGKKVWFWKCWSGHSLRPLGCGNLTFELWEWQDASWALSRHWLIDWYIIYNIYNIYVQWIMLSSPYITLFLILSKICWNILQASQQNLPLNIPWHSWGILHQKHPPPRPPESGKRSGEICWVRQLFNSKAGETGFHTDSSESEWRMPAQRSYSWKFRQQFYNMFPSCAEFAIHIDI